MSKEQNDQDSQNFDDLEENQNEEVQEEVHEDELSKLSEELAKAKEDLLRANADFENIKKRLQKEKVTAVSFANEGFAKDLLPVIDALELANKSALSEGDEALNKLKEGINLTIEEFQRCLAKHGIKIIDAKIGGDFDPEFHNAMTYIDSDEVESGKIAQIYQTGYLYNDRILRPTMVLIAK